MDMPNQLDVICSRALGRALDRKAHADIPEMERRASARTAKGWGAALRTAASKGPAIIAELKKASPSKGVIREHYEPIVLARAFEAGGAAALSVLTDEEFFQGSLADLIAVREAVSLPLLRKDFIVDPFQILEAKAAGADAILLIAAVHKDEDLHALHREAKRWGLDVLCETHTPAEIARAIDLGFDNIGVNSRDLKTMAVDTQRLFDMVSMLPENVLRVAESGIRNLDDIEGLMKAGYHAFLVGEALMRQSEPAAQLAVMLDTEYASKF
jgi:indole-3-glycerol phosphate synthase